jgi:hypothetical protein
VFNKHTQSNKGKIPTQQFYNLKEQKEFSEGGEGVRIHFEFYIVSYAEFYIASYA